MISFIFRLLAVIIIVYQLLILFRILLSWFGRGIPYNYIEMINRLTDPFLKLFRNVRISQTSNFDFSPIIGLTLLSILSQTFLMIAELRAFSLAAFLFILVQTLGNTLLWLAVFIGILLLLRFLSLTVLRKSTSPAWQLLDTILNPILLLVMKILRRNWEYPQLLIAAFLFTAIVTAAGFIGTSLLLKLIIRIPI